MGAIEYKTPNWDSHRECELLELDFPLFNVGVEDHFTFLRSFKGPLATLAMPSAIAVDSVFDGELHSSFVGTDADDILTLSTSHNLLTGIPVTVEVTAGLSNITDAATYYVIRVSAETIKLATTLANARAGTAVSLGSDGTADLRYPKAYLVGHSRTDDADGGQCAYTKLFATVPGSWSEPEAYSYTYPAVVAAAVGTARTVSAIAVSGSNLVLTVDADPSISSGDSCFVSVKFTRNGLVYQQACYTKATAASTATTATIGSVLLGSGAFSSVSGTIVKANPARTLAKTLDTPSRVVHDYAFSTATTIRTDLPMLERFSPVLAATGVEVDAITAATTSPTAAEYAALVTNGSELVAESSVYERYLGNIFVRHTRLVPAK